MCAPSFRPESKAEVECGELFRAAGTVRPAGRRIPDYQPPAGGQLVLPIFLGPPRRAEPQPRWLA